MLGPIVSAISGEENQFGKFGKTRFFYLKQYPQMRRLYMLAFMTISASTYCVFDYLTNFLNAENMAWPSLDLICRETGLNRATVQQAIKCLIHLKLDGQPVLCKTKTRGPGGQWLHNQFMLFPSPEYLAQHDPASATRLYFDFNSSDPTSFSFPPIKEFNKLVGEDFAGEVVGEAYADKAALQPTLFSLSPARSDLPSMVKPQLTNSIVNKNISDHTTYDQRQEANALATTRKTEQKDVTEAANPQTATIAQPFVWGGKRYVLQPQVDKETRAKLAALENMPQTTRRQARYDLLSPYYRELLNMVEECGRKGLQLVKELPSGEGKIAPRRAENIVHEYFLAIYSDRGQWPPNYPLWGKELKRIGGSPKTMFDQINKSFKADAVGDPYSWLCGVVTNYTTRNKIQPVPTKTVEEKKQARQVAKSPYQKDLESGKGEDPEMMRLQWKFPATKLSYRQMIADREENVRNRPDMSPGIRKLLLEEEIPALVRLAAYYEGYNHVSQLKPLAVA